MGKKRDTWEFLEELKTRTFLAKKRDTPKSLKKKIQMKLQ